MLTCLRNLKKTYPQITFSVVLAYLPTQRAECDLYSDCSIYPEGLELCHPKFAIDRRNRWLVDHAQYCVCYITHAWGGAYQFARKAKRQGLHTVNLGREELLL